MKASRLAVATAFCIGIFSASGYAQVAHDGTLASLHAALNLTASQEDSWHNFEQAYTPDPQEINKRRDAAKNMATLTDHSAWIFQLVWQRATLPGSSAGAGR